MLSPEALRFTLTVKRPEATFWPRRAQPLGPGDLALYQQQLRVLQHEPHLRLTYHVMDPEAKQEHRRLVTVVAVYVEDQRLHTQLCQTGAAPQDVWFARCADGRWRLAEGRHGPLVERHELCYLEIPLSATRTGHVYPRPEPVTLDVR